MKAYLIFLSVIVLSASATAETKEVMLINETGEVKLMEPPQTWHPLSQEQTTALNNPGQEVPINTLISGSKRIDFWHLAVTEKYNQVVVFKDGKITTISKIGMTESEPQIVIYVVLCLIAIGSMLISNLIRIGTRVRGDIVASIIFFSAAICFGLCFFNIITCSISLMSITASTIILVASIAAASAAINSKDDNIAYWTSSCLFYVFIIPVMFI